MAFTDQEKDTFYTQVGERIKDARKRAGLSQEDLAALIGLSRVSVVNIEKGRQSPPIHLVLEISNALNVSPGDFFPPYAEVKASQVKVLLGGNEWPEFVNLHKLIKFK